MNCRGPAFGWKWAKGWHSAVRRNAPVLRPSTTVKKSEMMMSRAAAQAAAKRRVRAVLAARTCLPRGRTVARKGLGDGSPARLLLQSEAAFALRVSTKTVQRLRESGRIRYIPGRPIRIPATEIEKLITETLCLGPTAVRASERTRPASTKSIGQKRAEVSGSAQGRLMLLKRRMRSASGNRA